MLALYTCTCSLLFEASKHLLTLHAHIWVSVFNECPLYFLLYYSILTALCTHSGMTHKAMLACCQQSQKLVEEYITISNAPGAHPQMIQMSCRYVCVCVCVCVCVHVCTRACVCKIHNNDRQCFTVAGLLASVSFCSDDSVHLLWTKQLITNKTHVKNYQEKRLKWRVNNNNGQPLSLSFAVL